MIHFPFNDSTRWLFGQALTVRAAGLKLLVLLPLSVALDVWVGRPARRAALAWWRRRRELAAERDEAMLVRAGNSGD